MNIKETNVTPKLAKEWLALNMPQNRKVKERLVNKIAADIAAGRWIENGSTIQFNKAGFLIDGQHRLHAIAKANKPVKIWVVTDVESAAINVIDTGVSRSMADVLHLNGMATNANAIAALARKILAIKQGYLPVQGRSARKLNTVQETLAFCQENDLLPYINYGMNCYQQAVTRDLLGTGEWAFIYWHLSQADAEQAKTFCMKLAKLHDVEGGVIRQLFERLTRSSVALDASTRLKMVTLCWNAWRKGGQPDLKLRKVQEEALAELV